MKAAEVAQTLESKCYTRLVAMNAFRERDREREERRGEEEEKLIEEHAKSVITKYITYYRNYSFSGHPVER